MKSSASARSVWRVMLHPVNHLRELEQANAARREDAETIATLTASLESLQRTLAARDKEMVRLATELSKSRSVAQELQDDLRKAYADLEDSREVDRRLTEFEEKLSQFQNLRHKYERTIENLRSEIRDKKHTIRVLTGEDVDNELTTIDLQTSRPQPEPPQPAPPSHKPSHLKFDSDEDWLSILPDTL